MTGSASITVDVPAPQDVTVDYSATDVVVSIQVGEVAANAAPLHHDHSQVAASLTWTIDHNLGFRPSVQVRLSDGTVAQADVSHASENRVVVTFSEAVSGAARLN